MTARTRTRLVELYRIGNTLILAITEGVRKLRSVRYELTPRPSDFGRAYSVRKLQMDGGDGTSYDVLLGESCECKGYLKHGHCRHLESLAELAGRGELGGVGDGLLPDLRGEAGGAVGLVRGLSGGEEAHGGGA